MNPVLRMSGRQRWLAMALLATLLAVAWAATLDEADAEDGMVQAIGSTQRMSRSERPVTAPSALGPVAAGPSQRLPWREPAAHELLAWGSIAVVAAPPPVQNEPAPDIGPALPVAPPFPYQLFGRLEADGGARALLMSAHGTLVVRVGELIDAQWRVERIAADGLGLIWLPARQPLHIPFKA